MNAISNTTTATANATKTGPFATFVAALGNVPVSALDSLKKAQKGLSLDELASAASKDENKASSLLGNYARIHFQIGQTLIHGNQTGLRGLAKASKKTSGAFRAMVDLGVCTPSGDLEIAVDKEIPNKKVADATWAELATPFVAHLWAQRETQREAESEARKVASEKKATEKEKASEKPAVADAESEVTPVVELSPGQQDDLAVIHIKNRFAQLSAENIEALRALLAVVPVATPAPAPVKKARAKKPA
jgi:hypothetical protein